MTYPSMYYRMRIKRILLPAVLLFAIPTRSLTAEEIDARTTAASAGWAFTKSIDPMTDEVECVASIVNETGHEFRLYNYGPPLYNGGPKGAIWAAFLLPMSSMDVLGSEPLIFRIDDRPAQDLSRAQMMDGLLKNVDRVYNAEPKWVQWHTIFSLDDGVELVDRLRDGQSIRFRYALFTGGTKDTTFMLPGSPAALDQLDACWGREPRHGGGP